MAARTLRPPIRRPSPPTGAGGPAREAARGL